MLPVSDLWNAEASNKRFEKIFRDRTDYYTIHVLPPLMASPDHELWICFPGFLRMEIKLYRVWGRHNILPKCGKVIVINGPNAIAGFTPYDSIQAMNDLDSVVRKLIDEHTDYALNIFGISAGTYPAFYFANKYKSKRLVAIAPGPRMGQGIYTSIFSQTLKMKCIENGYLDWETYDSVISAYNQENNVSGLPAGDDLIIFGGLCDRVIRNSGTREIAAICRSAGKNPRFKNYWFLDHISLGAWIGFINKLGFDPYLVKRQVGSKQEIDYTSF